MRPLIITEFMSLDGVLEAPGGGDHRSAGWTFQDIEFVPEVYELKGREQDEAGAMLMGRISYEEFAPVWPTMTEEFAGYNAMPRYVVSTSLEADDSRWPATLLRSLDDVAALKQSEGGPIIVHGSATLAQGLAAAGLVDRYHLLVFPVLLGAGKRLFATADQPKQKLAVVEQETYANGIVKQVLDVLS